MQQVKLALGDMDPAQSERMVQIIMDREAELRSKHIKFINQLNDTLRIEAKKREDDTTRLKRHLDGMTQEIRLLRKKRNSHDTLSTVSASTKATSLSTLSPLVMSQKR